MKWLITAPLLERFQVLPGISRHVVLGMVEASSRDEALKKAVVCQSSDVDWKKIEAQESDGRWPRCE